MRRGGGGVRREYGTYCNVESKLILRLWLMMTHVKPSVEKD